MNTGKENRAAARAERSQFQKSLERGIPASTYRNTEVSDRITMRDVLSIMAFLTPSGLMPPICIDYERDKVYGATSAKLEEAAAVSIVSGYAAKCTDLQKKAR